MCIVLYFLLWQCSNSIIAADDMLAPQAPHEELRSKELKGQVTQELRAALVHAALALATESPISKPQPSGQGAKFDGPPGFEDHHQSQGSHSLQPRSDPIMLQNAMLASKTSHSSDLSSRSTSAHDAAPVQHTSRAAMSAVPDRAAAQQVSGSSAAKAKLQQRLAANEEVGISNYRRMGQFSSKRVSGSSKAS